MLQFLSKVSFKDALVCANEIGTWNKVLTFWDTFTDVDKIYLEHL